MKVLVHTMTGSFKHGVPWVLVGVLSVLLWQALAAEAAPAAQAPAANAAPQMMSYQGVLDVDGTAYSGAGFFKFAIVDSATGAGSGNAWANDGTTNGEPGTAVELSVTNGLFAVLLGDTALTGMSQPLDATVFSQSETYLRVWFSETAAGPFEPLEPNQRLASVPYALRAEYAANAAALETRLEEVENQVAALETGLTDVEEILQNTDVADLASRLSSVENLLQGIDVADLASRLSDVENLLQFVSVSGTDMFITGANLHIRNGTGTTDGTVNSLGNLIIGYNEDSIPANDRTGSHNLILGRDHTYSSYGGLVAGISNTISAPYASVSGGRDNTASGVESSVSGGNSNTASGLQAWIGGGTLNEATGTQASVSGGRDNTASGQEASVSGGAVNEALGRQSSITGGQRNSASSLGATVSGGVNNTASGVGAVVSGGASNTASGRISTVSGGASNTAAGDQSTVGGGQTRTASGLNDWVAGGLTQNN